MRNCWCGNVNLFSFNSDYGHCKTCDTLVSIKKLQSKNFQVNDDDNDYYGKNYWLKHQKDDLGTPDIHIRSRIDLTERNLHWLETLLKYRSPPAKVLELGCSHASFVALMRLAGYDAFGIEMSPWVVEFGQKIFRVPILLGPVEDLDLPHGTLDVVVLMDVLEHLPNPMATIAHSLKLLKPDGLMLIQTPQFKGGITFAELISTQSRFLEMLLPEEHIYIFSERSVAMMFRILGLQHIKFEPAIFDHYDMYFVVAWEPFKPNDQFMADSALLDSSNGRLTLALLDLRDRERVLKKQFQESEFDRLARMRQIDTLTEMLKGAELRIKEFENELRSFLSNPIVYWIFKISKKIMRLKRLINFFRAPND